MIAAWATVGLSALWATSLLHATPWGFMTAVIFCVSLLKVDEEVRRRADS